MEFKKRTPFMWSLVLRLFAALLFSITLSIFAVKIAKEVRDNISLTYIEDISEYYEMFNEYFEKFGDGIPIPQIPASVMSKKDAYLVEICDFVQTWFPFIIISFSLFIALVVFYKKRFKTPFDLLRKSTVKIGKQNLDFSIRYDVDDELGELCKAFEKMRGQLYINNINMWTMLDEQKQLRAAFSHDLRTPMSVLKGYVEYLIRYFPKGKLSDEKIMEILYDLEEQIEHIEHFADTMKEINRLDAIKSDKCNVSIDVIYRKTQMILKNLAQKHSKAYSINVPSSGDAIMLDLDIYLEIVGNLIANAVRFSKSNVSVELHGDEGWLSVMIYDDGPGFKPEEIAKVKKPYYRGQDKEGTHYGIGLFICNTLCEKQGGRLILKNHASGGACAIVKLPVSPD